MDDLFLTVVNMSISTGWLVLAVLIFRLALKKISKRMTVLLWGFVAIRLVCPVSIESALSLIPSKETIPLNITATPSPAINSGVHIINDIVNPLLSPSYTVTAESGETPLQVALDIAEHLWILGMIVLVAYITIAYGRLSRKVRTAVRYQDNIFQSEAVCSPFVVGIVKPKIYLPFQLCAPYLGYVIAHEQAHIRRKDHWWKPLGFILLTVHWFNPLIWIAYRLLCYDLELACDETVIKELDNCDKADYVQTLVACSLNRRTRSTSSLAFVKSHVKQRVKSVMKYKSPRLFGKISAAILCIALVVCFLTSPPPLAAAVSEYPEEMKALSGEWTLDSTYTEWCNGGLFLSELWGVAVNDHDAALYLKPDGTLLYRIGSIRAKGTWRPDGDTGNFIATLTVSPTGPEKAVTFYPFRENPDSSTYLVFDEGAYSYYWAAPTKSLF